MSSLFIAFLPSCRPRLSEQVTSAAIRAGDQLLPPLSMAPSRPPPSSLPHHVIRKTMQATWRTITLNISRRRYRRPILLFTLILVVGLSVYVATVTVLHFLLHRHTDDRNNNSPALCRCNDSHVKDAVISSSIIARIIPLADDDDKGLRWRVHKLYKGPFISTRLPLLISSSLLSVYSTCLFPTSSQSSTSSFDSNIVLIAARSFHFTTDNHTRKVAIIIGEDDYSQICNYKLESSLHKYEPRIPYAQSDFHLTTTKPQHQKSTRQILKKPKGVSVIAACKDRSDTLSQSIPSWLAQTNPSINQLILVDWSSSPPLSLPPSTNIEGIDMLLVRVDDMQLWSLTRAYNIALRFVDYETTLKVDCDTQLNPKFLTTHPVHTSNIMYAGNRTVKNTNGAKQELHANGVLLVPTEALLSIGGYDERIVTYGWDDSDILSRLEKKKLTIRPIDLEYVMHVPHAARRRLVGHGGNDHRLTLLSASHALATAVEIQRNRLLLTRCRLPMWKATSPHCAYILSSSSFTLVTVRPVLTNGGDFTGIVKSAARTVDAYTLRKMNIKSLRIVLHRFGATTIPRHAPLSFVLRVADAVAKPKRYPSVTLWFGMGMGMGTLGQAIGAALAVDAANSVTPPKGCVGWRLRLGFDEPARLFPGKWCAIDDVFGFLPFEQTANDYNMTDGFKTRLRGIGMDTKKPFEEFDQLSNEDLKTREEMRWWHGVGIDEEQESELYGSRSLHAHVSINTYKAVDNGSDFSDDELQSVRTAVRKWLKPSDGVVSTVADFIFKMQTQPKRKHIADDNGDSDDDLGTANNINVNLKWPGNEDEHVQQVAAEWSGSSADVRSNAVHILTARARFVAASTSLAVQKDRRQQRHKHAVSAQVWNKAMRVSERVNHLIFNFPNQRGRNASEERFVTRKVAQLMNDVPELAVIAAALLSASSIPCLQSFSQHHVSPYRSRHQHKTSHDNDHISKKARHTRVTNFTTDIVKTIN